jgi:predicted kinase
LIRYDIQAEISRRTAKRLKHLNIRADVVHKTIHRASNQQRRELFGIISSWRSDSEQAA